MRYSYNTHARNINVYHPIHITNLLQSALPYNKHNAIDYRVCKFLNPFLYTGCPRRNMPDFGRMFLMLKYTDVTQNTYVQSSTVTEIMAREKFGLLAGPRTVPVS